MNKNFNNNNLNGFYLVDTCLVILTFVNFIIGNLSDGSGLLVQSFGDRIKGGDKIGVLLQLTDADMKMYLFHNERSLGLAFHVQSPYPKPLYPGK